MGLTAQGGPPPGQDQDTDLREDARETLTECEGRWKTFREEAGTALNSQMERSFKWLQNILGDDSKPTDWLKDGVALAIRCYGTGKELFDATNKLYYPKKD